MSKKIITINILAFAMLFLFSNSASADCTYVSEVLTWSDCENGSQVANVVQVSTVPGDTCTDVETIRNCGANDGTCSVGYMSDSYGGGYIDSGSVMSNLPDNSDFYNFDNSQYRLSNDPGAALFQSDMKNLDLLVAADSNTNTSRWNGSRWNLHFESGIKPAYESGMSVMTVGDHSACLRYGCAYSDDMVASMTNNLQNSFSWGGWPGKVSWRSGRMSSAIPFFDGLYYFTANNGLHTPGNIKLQGGKPDTCVQYVSGVCLFGYIEPSGSKGWLSFDGNVGYATYDSLSGDTTTGASIFDAIADCDGNSPPEATINTPSLEPPTVNEFTNNNVTLAGEANDPDGDSIVDYEWWNGSCGGGIDLGDTTTVIANLPTGQHTIYFRAQDDKGHWSDCDSVIINVVSLTPTTTLTATPPVVSSGDSSTLNWSSTNNPTSCTASGDWSGEKLGLSPEVVNNVTSQKTFNLVCENSYGPGNVATATVNILDCASRPPSCSMPPSNIDSLCVNATSFTGPVDSGSTFEWTCEYESSASVSCDSVKRSPENGVCGSAKNDEFNSLTSGDSNLCSSGNVNNFISTADGWEWDCDEICSGTSETGCTATRVNTSNWIEVPPTQ